MSKALLNPEIARVIRDASRHAADGSMVLVDDMVRVPAEQYTDPEIFQREIERVWRRIPLLLAAGCEIPNPGDYKTLEMAGIPVLLVRGQDGVARAFLNSCTHRGAKVALEPYGAARRFTCRYHGWTFGQKGELVGVASAADFGEVDKACNGLTALPTYERAGLIFGVMNRTSHVDIDDFLSGFDKMFEAFNLKDWHFFATHTIAGPNWKLNNDATIDTYHVPVLHKNTLAASGDYGNRALFYAWGPHQRMLNADMRIGLLVGSSRVDLQACKLEYSIVSPK